MKQLTKLEKRKFKYLLKDTKKQIEKNSNDMNVILANLATCYNTIENMKGVL